MMRVSDGSLRINTGVVGIPCVSLEICLLRSSGLASALLLIVDFFAFSEPADEIEEERVFALQCFCAVSNTNLLATSSRDFARLW